MITAYPIIATHLWQSTVFAAAAGLLTLLLKGNPARTRYWVWLAALVKFLVPYGILVSLGSHLALPRWMPPTPGIVEPAISFAIGDVATPIFNAAVAAPRPTHDSLPAVLLGVWACGVIVIAVRWAQRWTQLRADLRASFRLAIDVGIPVLCSPALREPGVFGIFRPVILLPEGMAEHLSKAEWEAVLAHELYHARCYDNLTAAIYMLGETIFWFHPLVWWMGKRLVAERENACDEEVLRLGTEPKAYAEGILKICELYLESQLECVAGVAGSNLRQRIRAIMTHRGTERVNIYKKLILAAASLAAVAGPLLVGLTSALPGNAQPRPALRQEFDVASVKRNTSETDRGVLRIEHGHLIAKRRSLKNLIQQAYGQEAWQLSGIPAWIEPERYDIDAKAEGTPTNDQVNRMLQTLLADRFKLVLRHDMKELPVLILLPEKNGPTLQQSKDGEAPSIGTNPGHQGEQRTLVITAQAMPLALLARLLSAQLDRPVLDETGLKGTFDFKLEIPAKTPGDTDLNSDGGKVAVATADPSEVIVALQSQLGLKLEAKRKMIEVLTVDHVEKLQEN